MKKKPKVIVIGLDGGTWEIINPLLKAGKLPTINALMKNGTYGNLESTIPPITAPAWTSFATGKIPGKHGCFHFVAPKERLDDLKVISTKDIKGETFYKVLYSNGYKYILINLPMSHPPLTDQPTLGSITTIGKNFIFPEILKDEIPELKDYRIVPNLSLKTNERIDEFIKDIRKLERHRFKCAKKLFNKEWDFFFLLFSGTDWIQHVLYHKIIENIKRKSFDEDVIKLYIELDSYIGWFINNISENTLIILMSDHGFKSYKGLFFINDWLKQEGYLKIKSTKGAQIKSQAIWAGITKYEKDKITIPDFLLKIGAFLNRFIPMNKIYLIIRKILPIKIAISTKPDLSKTLAFAITFGSHGVYINKNILKNYNIDYSIIRDEIIKKLKFLKNPKNDKPLFKQVLKREDIGGNNLQNAPDIIIILDEYNIIPSILHQIFDNHFSYLCNHHDPIGIFCISGSGIIKNQEIKNVKIIDLAPTIFHLFNVPIPDDVDGRVLKECFYKNSNFKK